MSLEEVDISNLLEFIPMGLNQHVKNVVQNYPIIKVDSSMNVTFRHLKSTKAAISSNIDKLRNTFCNQLTKLTSILKLNVNVEQT